MLYMYMYMLHYFMQLELIPALKSDLVPAVKDGLKGFTRFMQDKR